MQAQRTMIHLGQPMCPTALNQYIKMPTFLQFLTFFQGTKASKLNKQKPLTAAEEIEGFSEQEEVIKLLKEQWKCDMHSKGSKTPVYCYHHSKSNVCYPLTQSNLAYRHLHGYTLGHQWSYPYPYPPIPIPRYIWWVCKGIACYASRQTYVEVKDYLL